jgi:hypothetical protein
MLLNIEFTAERYPHSLSLTENIARCVLNRVRAVDNSRERLSYLAYYPEFELPQLNALWSDKNIDSRTADLAERPGEGVGFDAQPIQGDLCPDYLGEGPTWPAQPYSDWQYLRTLQQAGQPLPRCSHCLLDGITSRDRRELERRERRDERDRVELEVHDHPPPSAADVPEEEVPPADCAPEPGRTLETAPPASVCRCHSGDSGEAEDGGPGRLIHAPPGKPRSGGCKSCADVACGRN